MSRVRYTVNISDRSSDQNGVTYYRVTIFGGRSQWDVTHRYSDFVQLRSDLSPVMQLQELPPKSVFRKRLSIDYNDERQEALLQFLRKILDKDCSCQSPVLRTFLGITSAEALSAASAPSTATLATAHVNMSAPASSPSRPQDRSPYCVNITDRTSDQKGVTYYRITTSDGHSQWDTTRRYSDFVQLRSDLCPDMQLQELPNESVFRKRFSHSFNEGRHETLLQFLRTILDKDCSCQSAVLRAFLGITSTSAGALGAGALSAGNLNTDSEPSTATLATAAAKISTPTDNGGILEYLKSRPKVVEEHVGNLDDNDANKEIQEKMLNGQHRNPYSVNITDRTSDENGVTYYQVTIVGGHSQWDVIHRYSDFVQLRSDLSHVMQLQELPAKSVFRKRFSDSFNDERQEALLQFLRTVLDEDCSCQSPELRTFLGITSAEALSAASAPSTATLAPAAANMSAPASSPSKPQNSSPYWQPEPVAKKPSRWDCIGWSRRCSRQHQQQQPHQQQQQQQQKQEQQRKQLPETLSCGPFCVRIVHQDQQLALVAIVEGSRSVSWSEAGVALQDGGLRGQHFKHLLNEILEKAPFDSFAWECEPFTRSRWDAQSFQFALVALGQSRLDASPHAFGNQLDYLGNTPTAKAFNDPGGGQAVFVAPSQACPDAKVYANTAAFFRGAPEQQKDALWTSLANALWASVANLKAGPPEETLWVSAGEGLGWMHLRLDLEPSRFRHRPFRQLAQLA